MFGFTVLEARHLGGHRVWLRFADGSSGEADLGAELVGPVFEPLRDPGYFGQFVVDDTLTWSNGADIAPETLYELVTGRRCELCTVESTASSETDKPVRAGRGTSHNNGTVACASSRRKKKDRSRADR